MSRTRYIYRNIGGKYTAVPVGKSPARGTPDFVGRSFHENVLNAYKKAEEQGIPYRDSHSKTFVRDLHQRAAAGSE